MLDKQQSKQNKNTIKHAESSFGNDTRGEANTCTFESIVVVCKDFR
jgi:hypothetical protein